MELNGVIEKKSLIKYLQSQMDNYKKAEEQYGVDDREVLSKLHAMIACKEMAEALLKKPVNLQMDGKVTVGLK